MMAVGIIIMTRLLMIRHFDKALLSTRLGWQSARYRRIGHHKFNVDKASKQGKEGNGMVYCKAEKGKLRVYI